MEVADPPGHVDGVVSEPFEEAGHQTHFDGDWR